MDDAAYDLDPLLERPDEKIKNLARFSGDPWRPENKYFTEAEAHLPALWGKMIWPFIQDCDFTTALDLAAGHGRNSERLVGLTKELWVSDIQPGNVQICKDRFADHPHVKTFVGNGFDFEPLPDNSLTLIYCFDAMVHFDSDVVRSYLRDASRVLKSGGRGFFHHSNIMVSADWTKNPANRNFMSRELFAHYAEKEGLRVVRQKVIDWNKHKANDCLSLVEKP